MRILAVSDFFPWPTTNGGLIRRAHAFEALSELGELELFTLFDRREAVPEIAPGHAVSRLGTTPHPRVDVRWRVPWLLHRGMPMEVAMRRSDTTPRRDFESWVADRYDVIWFCRPATFEWMGRPNLGPTIVDLDDLDSEKERNRASAVTSGSSGAGAGDRARRALRALQARLNARDWDGFQRSVTRSVDRVVLSSPLDVQRSQLEGAVVIPNTYPRPARPLGRSTAGQPPVILFQGTFDYAPNAEGAQWLADELAPQIRSRIPGAEIRLVGRTTPGVEALDDPGRVTVVGRIPSMEPELARADLAVVPLRNGSGTRLKILESFAHRIPVVSTSMGADGLEVEHGVHLLIADDPDQFAAACERVVNDAELRLRMVDAAERRYLERYEATAAREQIKVLAREVAGESDRGTR